MASYAGTEFPKLYACQHLLGPKKLFISPERPTVYDVKFFPYDKSGEDSIFAVTGGRETFVCRAVTPRVPLQKGEKTAFEILSWIRDDNEDADPSNSIAWALDPVTKEPLLCVTGSEPIKIYNAITGKPVKILRGHGGNVNDLAVSPLDPGILFSGSADKSIRIWRLHPKFEKQPCTYVLGGANGHQEDILSIGFHKNGRYLLSGGQDNVVNLWVVPELSVEDEVLEIPDEIHYPHFSSTEIHDDFVDCVQFFGDLIISRCAVDNTILIWSITGFSSNAHIPSEDAAPARHLHGRDTLSAWTNTNNTFQRLMKFYTPDSSLFYMRFGLYQPLSGNPMLAIGNEINKIYFWDLAALEIIGHREPDFKKPEKKSHKKGVAQPINRESSVKREGSIASTGTAVTTATSSSIAAATKTISAPPTDFSNPFKGVKPHHVEAVPGMKFAARQVAWSPNGKWCVHVGDHGMVCLSQRGFDDRGRSASVNMERSSSRMSVKSESAAPSRGR